VSPTSFTSCPEILTVRARLDARPELLFELRGFDQGELIARAGKNLPLARKGPRRR
jgi:hypothetical protein